MQIRCSNKINRMTFTGFTASDNKLWWCLVYKFQGKGLRRITVTKKELISLSGLQSNHYTNKEWKEKMTELCNKLHKMDSPYSDKDGEPIPFTIFDELEIGDSFMTFKINPMFVFLFNELT